MSAATIQNEVTAALRFAAQVADLVPGVGPIVGTLLNLAPEAMALVSTIVSMAQGNRGPTADEQAQLNALIVANSQKLHEAAIRAQAALDGQPA